MALLDNPDVLIIGAGLMGLSTARALAGRGARVLLLERDLAGRHASSLNAGGVRRVNRHPAELPLAEAAFALWPGLSDALGAEIGFCTSGHLLVAEDAAELDRLAGRAALANALGWAHERLVNAAEVRALAPALSPHVLGGLWGERDGYADPRATCAAYRDAAERLGVTLLEGTALTGLAQEEARQGAAWIATTTAGRVAARTVINCAGAWGGVVAAMLGDAIPLEPRAPMALVLAPRPAFLGPVVQTLLRRLTLKQMPDGRVAIGGGHRARLPQPGAPEIVAEEAEANLETAVSLFPGALAGARPARVWAATEGYAPDGVAVVGRSVRHAGVFHAVGFSGHGFALAPAVGPVLADLVEGRAPAVALDALAPARFGPVEA